MRQQKALGLKENRSILEQVADALREIARNLRTFLKGNTDNPEARAIIDDADALMQLAQQMDEALKGAKENAERIPAEALKEINAHKGARYSIETDDFTREQYVKADRQVLAGTDPLVWKKQIEQYIKNVIRNDEDIIIPTSDGHFLILTERSAYKLSDRHIARIAAKAEQYLSDEQYRLKGEIATHIDELVKLARFGKFKEDINHKHENDIGEDGFNYYIAHFMDQAGQYYRIRFSSAINKQNETVYSIGDIQKRRFPNRDGSSSNKNNEALYSVRKSSGSIIYSTEDKSQGKKTNFQLAFEKRRLKNHGYFILF